MSADFGSYLPENQKDDVANNSRRQGKKGKDSKNSNKTNVEEEDGEENGISGPCTGKICNVKLCHTQMNPK